LRRLPHPTFHSSGEFQAWSWIPPYRHGRRVHSASPLYVATRGRDEVRFIYQNKPSPFIVAMNDSVQFQTWKMPPLPGPIPKPAATQEPKPTEKEEVVPVELPTEVPEQPVAARDGLIDFFETHTAKLLNGTLIVPIPSGAPQWELARALGHPQTAVSLACQQ